MGVFVTVQAADQSDCPQNKEAPSGCPQGQIAPASESIVVTGVFEPMPVDSSDRSVSVIDPLEAPSLYRHWAEYLQLAPSVDLRERAPDGVQADLSIRGSSFGQTLVLLNGLRMNDAQTAHHNLDLPLPSDSLARIEILR